MGPVFQSLKHSSRLPTQRTRNQPLGLLSKSKIYVPHSHPPESQNVESKGYCSHTREDLHQLDVMDAARLHAYEVEVLVKRDELAGEMLPLLLACGEPRVCEEVAMETRPHSHLCKECQRWVDGQNPSLKKPAWI